MFESKISKRSACISRPIVAGAALLALLLAAGCETDMFKSRFFVAPPYVDSSFGDAIAHNQAVQVVNPNPPAHQRPPNLNGLRAGVGIGRYHSNRSIRPEEVGVESGDSGN